MARIQSLRSVALVAVISLAAAGCASGSAGPGLVAQSDSATVTQLPVEVTSPKPTKKPAATAKATTKPSGKFYKPPGWNGSSDVNCTDFDTHAHAQSFFKGTGGTKSNDPYGLDRDHDGIACETLP